MLVSIAELNIHPLKSGAIQPLEQATIGPYGLLHDRLLMVVDSNGDLVSQRRRGMERMALIRCSITARYISLIAPGISELWLDVKTADLPTRTVTVHKQACKGLDLGDAAANWISRFLSADGEQSLRLVRFDERSHRALNPHFVPDQTLGTAFADGMPLLITSRESLEELNARLSSRGHAPVRMSRFRPNIVLEGGDSAFFEDRVRGIAMNGGAVEIEIVKPCERCSMITVDQELGAAGTAPGEPLSTLGGYRRGVALKEYFPNLRAEDMPKVYFGVSAVVKRGAGEVIAVGDGVNLVERRCR